MTPVVQVPTRYLVRAATAAVMAVTVWMWVVPASADIIIYDDRSAFNSASGPLDGWEDFEESTIGDGNIAKFGDPLDSTTDNAWFDPGDIDTGISFSTAYDPYYYGEVDLAILGDGFSGQESVTLVANYDYDYLIITFTDPVNAFGFDLFSLGWNSTLQILIQAGGQNSLLNVPAFSDGTKTFFGVTSSEYISAVSIDSLSDSWEGVDNVAYGIANDIPEPGTLGLMCMGLLGIGLGRRSRKV